MRTRVLQVAISLTFFSMLLAGCGSTTPTKDDNSPKVAELAIPTDCEKTGINEALDAIVPGSLYIPTQWQPATGTELADFLNNDGLACSYGLQSAEIGTTVKWVSDKNDLFEKRVTSWLADGFTKVSIPGLEDSDSYFLLKKQSATQEFHVWILNIKYRGAWIQLSCTAFAQDLESGLPLLKAAVSK